MGGVISKTHHLGLLGSSQLSHEPYDRLINGHNEMLEMRREDNESTDFISFEPSQIPFAYTTSFKVKAKMF